MFDYLLVNSWSSSIKWLKEVIPYACYLHDCMCDNAGVWPENETRFHKNLVEGDCWTKTTVHQNI